ncbi:MAG TPA: GTPase HflX [Oligoflexia bacterium]|nr:GTPase HflX [Oligoflexia bacterium]
MKEVVGDTKQLRASQRRALERLGSKRTNPRQIVDQVLARHACQLAAQLDRQLALLLDRQGEVTHVVLGTRERLYLPDLGRFRLEGGRLRRLRLVVFLPQGVADLRHIARSARTDASGGSQVRRKTKGEDERDSAFEIPKDLLTDLEKLRLDALGVVAVDADGVLECAAFVHLEPKNGTPLRTGRTEAATKQGFNVSFVRDLEDLQLDFERFVRELENRFRAAHVEGYDTSKEHAVLVGAYTGSAPQARSSMDELKELARTAEIQVLDCIVQRRRELDPKTLIGRGKLEQLVLHCLDLDADLLIFDRELSPGQLRSIGNLTELRLIDRSMLILDIFAQRAKSSEGRLQVELAQLKYSLPRLTEKDTGLSRLTGGIGGRGPGETKLEISRRRARDRIVELEKRIEKLARQRGLRRERRQERGVPVIAIVGYTNSGKSTLLNALTKKDTLVESKLFATLDPASKRMRFPNDREVVFVDTVGFIRELPKELVAAFRATLEEVGEADLLLHLVDAANPDCRQQIEVVENTLLSLGFGETPRILVLNKCDLLSPLEVKMLENTIGGLPVSAVERSNFHILIERLQGLLGQSFRGRDPGRFTELAPW